MKEIDTPHAPKAVGHYSQAVTAGNWVYCSGQISQDPSHDVARQADQIFQNLAAVLAAAGSSLNQVVKTTVYLTNMDDYAAANAAYARAFGDHRPARACVQVARLPKDVQIEIDAVAYIEGA